MRATGWVPLLLAGCSFDASGVLGDDMVADDEPGLDGDPSVDGAPPDGGGADDAPAIDAATVDPRPDAAPPDCPDDYDEPRDLSSPSRYRFVGDQVRSWAEAVEDCADDLVGYTHLVIIGDDGENARVDALSDVRDVWIGVTRAEPQDAWVTVLGGPQVYLPWGSMQPDDTGGDEGCVELRDGGAWNDLNCNAARRYVCECDRTAAPAP